MKIFEHENIVKLLGVCTKGEPAFAIMELMIHGELHFVALLKARILTTITITIIIITTTTTILLKR